MPLSLSEFISRIETVTGKNAERHGSYYKCRCPGHDDDKASLTVKLGDKGGILIKCFAGSGCEKDHILKSMGLTWKDIMPPDIGQFESEDITIEGITFPATNRKRKVIDAYIYRSVQGEPLYAVLREDPKGDFPQGRIVDGAFVWGLGDVKRTIYNLPAVVKAAQNGELIYIVEGEKDCKAIAKLGGVATCNSGGAGKWLDEFTHFLKGAKVVIVRDKDGAGRDHAKMVAASCRKHNVPCSIVESAEGKDAFDHIKAGYNLDEFIEAEDEPYVFMGGKAFLKIKNKDGGYEFRQLANFEARVIRENYVYTGIKNETIFTIQGAIQGCEPKEFEVRSLDFSGLSWVIPSLGAKAIISPGQNIRDQLRVAIQTLSDPTQHTIYAQAGWHLIDKEWTYITAAGGLTKHGINNKLEVDMGRVGLNLLSVEPHPDPYPAIEALRQVLSPEIWTPLIGTVFLAPLRPFVDPDYALFICGESGKFKSEIAAIGQSFYGKFKRATLPGNFESTANYVELVLHAGKDCAIVIDDYYPANDRVKAAQLASTLDRLLRGVGNSSSRGRLNADSQARAGYAPKSMPIITAEKLPIGQSNSARAYIVELTGAIIAPTNLTVLQRFAREGAFAGAMYDYVSWIAANWDRLEAEVPEKFEVIRDGISEGGHRRASSNSAWVLLGVWAYTQWLRETGKLQNEFTVAQITEAATLATKTVIRDSAVRNEGSSYPEIFISALQEGFIQGKVHLCSRSGRSPENAEHFGWAFERGELAPQGDMIGYLVDRQIWLLPSAAYGYCCDWARRRDQVFGIDKMTLFKRMADREWLIPHADKLIAPVNANGGTVRVVRIPRDLVEGEPDQGDLL